MADKVSVEEILEYVEALSVTDKIRLLARLAPSIERDVNATGPSPRRSLRGLWLGHSTSEEDIDEARREMWASFPRADI